jgi:hypothetical protein
MAADLLQQLRDIHLPDPPPAWPPAPGWWLVALLLLAGLAWLAARAIAHERRRRPIRRARHLYADVYRRHQAGELSTREYLNASNELLKRLFIHGMREPAARRANGRAWLELLDRHAEGSPFTEGPGTALGDERFRPVVDIDARAVHESISGLLARLRPTAGGYTS